MRCYLGARGIDYMQRTKNSVTTTGFPLYDGHGNMIATLARSGSNSWSLNDKRYFDAWGDVEHGNGTGQPSQRYCANLGHVQDDESDLIYMRARHYEPTSGRFISQDPARDGKNWYRYAENRPTIASDPDGQFCLYGIFVAILLTAIFLTIEIAKLAYRYVFPVGMLIAAMAFIDSVEPPNHMHVGAIGAAAALLMPSKWEPAVADLLKKMGFGGTDKYLGRLGAAFAGILAYGLLIAVVWLVTELWTMES